MRFLTDQDVYQVTVDWLRRRGHDVVAAREIGLARASDRHMLERATEMQRILITRDKDFGTLVFLEHRGQTGVVLLRMTPTTVDDAHDTLGDVIDAYSNGGDMACAFIVVEPGRYRVRRLNG